MRVTGFWSAVALVLYGAIIADLVAHWQGTQALAAGITQVQKPSLQAVSGQAIT